MTIKKCTCCDHKIDTKRAKFLGKTKEIKKTMLWFNCDSCGSTVVIGRKNKS